MRVICVAGARPNYMKIKPVMDALEERGAEVILVHTGQHYDPAMNDVFFTDLAIRQPDYFLGAGPGSHAAQTGRVMTAFEPLAGQVRPDTVVVVGDVNSTMACALVTAKSGALLAHVEAGLRSRDWSMPEEINRVVTDRVSDYLFAPSADAVGNLQAEGYRDDQIHLAGNVMADTLLANIDRATSGGTLSRLGLKPGGYGLATLHRRQQPDPRHTPGRVPRLHRAAGISAPRSHRLRRRPGGNHHPRRPLPHPARQHRTPHHAHRRHQPAGRTRPRQHHRSSTRRTHRPARSPPASPVGRPRSTTHRRGAASRYPGRGETPPHRDTGGRGRAPWLACQLSAGDRALPITGPRAFIRLPRKPHTRDAATNVSSARPPYTRFAEPACTTGPVSPTIWAVMR